jgi:hypothetical protein
MYTNRYLKRWAEGGTGRGTDHTTIWTVPRPKPRLSLRIGVADIVGMTPSVGTGVKRFAGVTRKVE